MDKNATIKVLRIIIPETRPLFSTIVLSATSAMLLGNPNPRDVPISELIIEAKKVPSINPRRAVEIIPIITDVNSNVLRLILLPIKPIVTDQKNSKANEYRISHIKPPGRVVGSHSSKNLIHVRIQYEEPGKSSQIEKRDCRNLSFINHNPSQESRIQTVTTKIIYY